MTKQEIIAELRRSACEDERPWYGVSEEGFDIAYEVAGGEGPLFGMGENLRTFFLLVACALEG